MYPAKVYSTSDPTGAGRIQMYVPQVFGSMPVKIWAPPVVPRGNVVPSVGDIVWCLFQGGDPAFPTYIPETGGGGVNVPAGDLGGTDTDPTVVGIQGRPIINSPSTEKQFLVSWGVGGSQVAWRGQISLMLPFYQWATWRNRTHHPTWGGYGSGYQSVVAPPLPGGVTQDGEAWSPGFNNQITFGAPITSGWTMGIQLPTHPIGSSGFDYDTFVVRAQVVWQSVGGSSSGSDQWGLEVALRPNDSIHFPVAVFETYDYEYVNQADTLIGSPGLSATCSAPTTAGDTMDLQIAFMTSNNANANLGFSLYLDVIANYQTLLG